MLLKPNFVFNSVCDITPDFLNEQGIKALILDLDNTLTTHNNPRPADGVLDWISQMKSSGIKLVILSNNHYPRIKPFADVLGLEFITEAGKPLTGGYKRAVKALELEKCEIASVGDQIFTDVLGCNFAGIKCIFTFPIEYETGFWFRVKRTLEKPLLPKRSKERRA